MKKKKILLLFGGESSEHEVSRKSAAAIVKKIDHSKYEIYQLGITRKGKWILTSATPDEIESGMWENRKDNVEAILLPDATIQGIMTKRGEVYEIDCVWPVLHGKNGEDGSIQGLCQLAGLRYVGSDIAASAIGMDKAHTKILLNSIGIEQAAFYLAEKHDYSQNPEEIIMNTEIKFDYNYPLFVKPTVSGSSVGISKVRNKEELYLAYEIAFKESPRTIVEEAIVGQEVEVAVLGNHEPLVSRVGEILSAGEWYDYKSKYQNQDSKTLIPANINLDVEHEIQECALKIYKFLGCKGLARVDFFVKNDSTVIFNEINTLPGFTNISMYPLLWEETGIPYAELIDHIISYALEQ